MQAVLMVGHGSLRRSSGAAMLRLAARARAAGLAGIVEAGFLNYSRPAFLEALARCVEQGASEAVIQPYFLVPGKFVQEDMPRVLESCRAAFPQLRLRLAAPFADHPALAQLLLKRAAQMERPSRPGAARAEPATALLVVAHGSPTPGANEPVARLVERIAAQGRYAVVSACYLDLNQPSLGRAIDAAVAQGMRRVVVTPYFLQLGGHVAADLPAAIQAAQARHPGATILLAEHLSYDPLLVSVIADRVQEALGPVREAHDGEGEPGYPRPSAAPAPVAALSAVPLPW